MPDPWQFGTEPKLHSLSARSVSAAETERRVQALLPRVPVTRVSDLTPLDPCGLPVFVAVTPLARDLTTHAGKGLDATSARLSAIMEAIERVSAEAVDAERISSASYRELQRARRRALDPTAFHLPDDTSYRPEQPLDWVESYDLLQREAVLLPLDLAISPPVSGLLREVDTNGLASGNTLLEAVVHALCEVIERDTLGQLEFMARFGDAVAARGSAPERRQDTAAHTRLVAARSLPDSARAWAEQLAAEGLVLSVHWLESDLAIPVFRANLVEQRYPSRDGSGVQFFAGFGCHPSAELALLRALTEAVQSRLGFIHGGRDSLGSYATSMRVSPTPGAELTPSLEFAAIRSGVFATLNEDLAHLLESLERAGVERVIVTDLTRREWELPVVRVRVPGLSSFFVNRRRVDRRCLRHLLPA